MIQRQIYLPSRISPLANARFRFAQLPSARLNSRAEGRLKMFDPASLVSPGLFFLSKVKTIPAIANLRKAVKLKIAVRNFFNALLFHQVAA